MVAAPTPAQQKRDKRLRLTVVSSQNNLDQICIYSVDKREVAKQLIEQFQSGGKDPASFDFRKLDLSGVDMRGLNLRALGAQALRQINFSNTNLSGQNLSGLNLRGANFSGAHMEGVNLEDSNLENAKLKNTKLIRSNLRGVVATGADMTAVKAVGSLMDGSFKGVKAEAASFTDCFMGNANFENAFMRGTTITGNTGGGKMTFRYAKVQGSKLYGTFTDAIFDQADLTGTDMEGGKFEGASFTKADVTGINTKFAKLSVGAFSNAIDYGPLNMENEIALPKPSFGSRKKEIDAIMKNLAPETPDGRGVGRRELRVMLAKLPAPRVA